MQISRDCQELEPSIGEQLASMLYLEPDSELMVFLLTLFFFLFKEVALGRSYMRCTEFSLLYVLNRAEKATVSALTLTLHSLLVTWMHEAPLLL